MNSTLLYTATLGPPVGDPTAVYAPPCDIKGRRSLCTRSSPDRHKLGQLSHSCGKAIQHTVDVGYYAPAARTTLNPAVFIVFLSEIDLRPATPRVYTLGARAGAFRHPAVVSSTTTFGAPGRGALAGSSSSLLRPHGSRGRRGDDGGCGILHATCLSRSCSRGNCACGAATVGGDACCSPARVRAPIKGPLTSCERRSAGSG